MKKLLLMIPIFLTIFLVWCNKQPTWNIWEQININKPIETPILKQWKYSLDCSTKYYTNTNIGGEIVDESYIKTSIWHERNTLYVDWESAKFFGADYQIIQDDENYLIMIRHYGVSGLTEVVSINKSSWIGFDVKTLAFWFSWAPVSDTYILSCLEI